MEVFTKYLLCTVHYGIILIMASEKIYSFILARKGITYQNAESERVFIISFALFGKMEKRSENGGGGRKEEYRNERGGEDKSRRGKERT